jgi:hypothetical protein
MNNQTIGIAGVFALTFFLLVVRHCIYLLGERKRRRCVASIPLRRVSKTSCIRSQSRMIRGSCGRPTLKVVRRTARTKLRTPLRSRPTKEDLSCDSSRGVDLSG